MYDLEVFIGDVATAFLHAPVDEEVYLIPPSTDRKPGKI